MNTFKVGDLAILIHCKHPHAMYLIGHEVEIVGQLNSDGDHQIIPVPSGYFEAFCPPEFLMKITPPPETRDEDEPEELVIVR